MTQEALKLALEALEELNSTNSYWWQDVDEETIAKIDPAITAIKQALAQKQEPIAMLFGSLPVYDHTAPPQRTWVGLTDLQKQVIKFAHSKMGMMMIKYDLDAMLEATEQALKEKNT